MSVFLYALRGDTRPGYISQGGGRGGGAEGGGGSNRFWERKAGKCVKCAYRRRNSPPAASTPLRAGSASSMKNKMRAPPSPLRALWRAFFWGCERREKGRFHLRLIQHAARSADTQAAVQMPTLSAFSVESKPLLNSNTWLACWCF